MFKADFFIYLISYSGSAHNDSKRNHINDGLSRNSSDRIPAKSIRFHNNNNQYTHMATTETIQYALKTNQVTHNPIDPNSTPPTMINLPGTDFNQTGISKKRETRDMIESNNDQDNNNYLLIKKNSVNVKSSVRSHSKNNYDLLSQSDSLTIIEETANVPEINMIDIDYNFTTENIAAAKESLV